MTPCGYAGQSLVLDLRARKSRREGADQELFHQFLGGLGTSLALFHSFSHPATPPLDPGNPIVLGAGPLVGTLAPGAARFMATTRFPLTGAVAAASGSMGFGAQMRWAGLDHLSLLDRAPRPVCVVVIGGEVRFEGADGLWGKGVHETTRTLKQKYGEEGSVVAIGPAGEACLPFAIALVDSAATLGRGGLGAVMGAKNLKAIYVRGIRNASERLSESPGQPIKVAHRKDFLSEVRGLQERARSYPLHAYCVEKGMMAGWELGLDSMFRHPVWTREEIDAAFGQAVYQRMKKKRLACPSCFIADKDLLEWEHKGRKFAASFTSYINLVLAALVGVRDAGAAASLLCTFDDAGVDLFTFGRMLQVLFLSQEAGRLPGQAEAGRKFERGQEGCLELLDLAIRRHGAGELFHLGLKEYANCFDKECTRDLVTIKGQDVLYDPRETGLGTMEFEQVVCPRGPTSASAGSPSYLPGQPLERFRTHAQRMGVPSQAAERIFRGEFGLHIGRLTRYSEDWYALFSSLGVCNRAQVNRFYHIEIFSRLYRALTGIGKSGEELMEDSERIWNLFKLLNVREGFSRADDCIPDVWFEDKELQGQRLSLKDYFRTRRLAPDDLDCLLEGYYQERGWSPLTGTPTDDTICRLGLERFAAG